MFAGMANPYGITLDDDALRWAAAEGVSETVIAAVHLLPERGVDEVVAKLTAPELERVIIKLVGLSPPGTFEALKSKTGTLSGTRPGTRAETVRRRMVIEDLMKLDLSVRAMSAGTGIPPTSVFRAMRAIARAEAKKQVAVANIVEEILGKTLAPAAEGDHE
jgi:hypothetical protein